MERLKHLLALLADGELHSGQALGETLGVSRAAVWKLIARLKDVGVHIEAEAGNGYRLEHRFQPLGAGSILDELSPAARSCLESVEVELSIESTNQQLLAVAPSAHRPRVLLAEAQTAGRGRRGRQWYSPFGASLYLSLLWPFAELRRGLSGLSLVAGLAVVEALTGGDEGPLQLKWPNDVVYQDRKLAGVLVEVTGEPQGPCQVVIGIGVNCRLPADAGGAIDQPWTDVASMLGAAVDRNRLAADIIESLCRSLPLFAHEGFSAFRDAWSAHDALRDRVVQLQVGSRLHEGVMRGVNDDGALLLDDGTGSSAWVSGEVSVRLSS